jgi:hypothetical protein
MRPFAYISKDGVFFKELPPSPWLELTPLYTSEEINTLHQLVKEQQDKIDELNNPIFKAISMAFNELTDAEIQEIWESKKFCGDLYIDYIAFARAIIRKASGG